MALLAQLAVVLAAEAAARAARKRQTRKAPWRWRLMLGRGPQEHGTGVAQVQENNETQFISKSKAKAKVNTHSLQVKSPKIKQPRSGKKKRKQTEKESMKIKKLQKQTAKSSNSLAPARAHLGLVGSRHVRREVTVAAAPLAAGALAGLRPHRVLISAVLALPFVGRRLGGTETHFDCGSWNKGLGRFVWWLVGWFVCSVCGWFARRVFCSKAGSVGSGWRLLCSVVVSSSCVEIGEEWWERMTETASRRAYNRPQGRPLNEF